MPQLFLILEKLVKWPTPSIALKRIETMIMAFLGVKEPTPQPKTKKDYDKMLMGFAMLGIPIKTGKVEH